MEGFFFFIVHNKLFYILHVNYIIINFLYNSYLETLEI